MAKGSNARIFYAGKEMKLTKPPTLSVGDPVVDEYGFPLGVVAQPAKYTKYPVSVQIDIKDIEVYDSLWDHAIEEGPDWDENDPFSMGYHEFLNTEGRGTGGYDSREGRLRYLATQYDFDDERDIQDFIDGWKAAEEVYIPF